MSEKTFIKVNEATEQREVIIPIEDIVYVKRDVDNPRHTAIKVARGDFSKNVVVPWPLEEAGRRLNARMSDDPQIFP